MWKWARQEEDPSPLHPEHISDSVPLWEGDQRKQDRAQGIFKRKSGRKGLEEIERGEARGLSTLELSVHPSLPQP